MATVRFGDDTIVRIVFDTGSLGTYITRKLRDKLNVPDIGEENISAAQFGLKKRKNLAYVKTKVYIPTREGHNIAVSALVTDSIACPLQKYPVDDRKHPILKQVAFAEPLVDCPELFTIDILIGADHYYDFVGCEKITLEDGLFLISSKLGYILTGRVSSDNADEVMLFQETSHVSNTFDVEKFWALEEVGIKDNPYISDDERALESFNAKVKLVNNRYEVGWPWKEEHPELPANYGLAYGLLRSLTQKLAERPQVRAEYDKTICDKLNKGVIEEVPESEIQNSTKLVYYIPHHCVIREDKATTKLRVVYDASAKSSKVNPSLNKCLLRGPVILQDLVGMILRFRLQSIAFYCDIEKTFLQVSLRPVDRDVTRFLWLKDPDKSLTSANMITDRFCRVPFGMISSHFLLSATVKHFLSEKGTPVTKDIVQNIYVDSVLGGRNKTEDAINFYKEAKEVFYAASMNIRYWYTNSKELCEKFQESDKGKGTKTRILELVWDTANDTFSCSALSPEKIPLTKRSLLNLASSVFDPCGIVCPITVRGKLLVQDLWKANKTWDEKVNWAEFGKVEEVFQDISAVDSISIPRKSANLLETNQKCFYIAFAILQPQYTLRLYIYTQKLKIKVILR